MALGSQAPEMSGLPSAFLGAGPLGAPSPRPGPWAVPRANASGLAPCALSIPGVSDAINPSRVAVANVLLLISDCLSWFSAGRGHAFLKMHAIYYRATVYTCVGLAVKAKPLQHLV